MSFLLSYDEFLNEDATTANSLTKPPEPAESINFADETLEPFRRKLLDKYFEEVSQLTPDAKNKINKCISTYVYALDKRLKIDEDIINLLAETVGKDPSEVSKELAKMTNEFYDELKNVIG
jgi:DNA polymerase III delta subunit